MKKLFTLLLLFVLALVCVSAGCVSTPQEAGDGTITITDSGGRVVIVPDNPGKIAVSEIGRAHV